MKFPEAMKVMYKGMAVARRGWDNPKKHYRIIERRPGTGDFRLIGYFTHRNYASTGRIPTEDIMADDWWIVPEDKALSGTERWNMERKTNAKNANKT